MAGIYTRRCEKNARAHSYGKDRFPACQGTSQIDKGDPMKVTQRLSGIALPVENAPLGARVKAAFSFHRKFPKRAAWIAAAVVVVAVAAAAAYYKLVYVPANTAIVTPMQTAVVHEGSLILSASGSCTLVAKDEVDLSFESGGTVTEVGVKVGDQVKQGDLLAKIDDTDLQTAYTEAKRALDELTSSSAVLDAEAAVATAQSDLDEAIQHLEYIISPTVYYWENQVRARQTALDDAKAAAAASPTDAAAQAAVDKADASLKSAQASLASAQYSYENTYVRQNFVYYVMDGLTHKKVRYETEPSDADIAEARAALAAARPGFKCPYQGSAPGRHRDQRGQDDDLRCGCFQRNFHPAGERLPRRR